MSRGLPGGGFDTRKQFNFGLGQFTPRDFQATDVDDDGRPDMVVSNGGNQNTVIVRLSQADGELSALPPLPIGENVEGLALAHFNPGPELDLAIVTQRPEFFPGNSSNQLHVLHGDGAGSFSTSQVVDLHAAPKEVLPGDFDGDRLSDLLIGER